MTPEERQTLEHRAERALKRGELRDALAMFRALADAFPEDPAVRARLGQLEGSVEPLELMGARGGFRSEPSNFFASPQHEAEAHAARGDFRRAIDIYRSLIKATPSAELFRERLTELEQHAQARAPVPTATKTQLLEHLLERIASRRR